jgi:transposase
MIDYHTYHEIHRLHQAEDLSAAQIATHLALDEKTVAKWLERPRYQPRQGVKRASKLDPYKATVIQLLEKHPYSSVQLLQRLREAGYTGGYSILKNFVHQVRPAPTPAFLTLQFAPGECAQVDWAEAGLVPVGATRRRLHCFLMVLCYSRRLYAEFTLGETLEHFLACHQHAFEYFEGVPQQVMVDNCKVAVLQHPYGQPAVLNPRYQDLAQHYGFEIKACTVRRPNQKGRVEKSVDYLKGNFLRGLELTTFEPLNPALRLWLETVANVRVHGETHQKPNDRFVEEKPHLRPLPMLPYEAAVVRTVRANSRFRVQVDTNRYSVPARYAGALLTVKLFPDRLCVYHQEQLVAEHVRRYERYQDYELPEHAAPLLVHARNARQQRVLTRFLALSPQAPEYYRQLEQRRSVPRHHLEKIVGLSEVYGIEKVGRALEDALHFQAFSADYIANILEQRERKLPEPGALHLTRQQDLLDLELPEPDLSVYDPQSEGGQP